MDLGGGRTLEFMPSAMLHWADSMFTWCPQDKVLFTCDFLGAPLLLSPPCWTATSTTRRPIWTLVAHYYNCIFGPFKPHVLAGLDKIEPLDPSIICPSHGPCLTGRIAEIEGLYRQWSTSTAKTEKMAAVLCSAYGCTAALAEAAAAALRESGLRVEMRDVATTPPERDCRPWPTSATCWPWAPPPSTGTPPSPSGTWSPPSTPSTAPRSAFVFGSYGWSGEGPEMLRSRLAQLRFSVPDAAFRCAFTPAQADLDAVTALAKEAAAKLG